MRRWITAAAASLLLLTPASVSAGIKNDYSHAYYTVAKVHGKDAPGRNIRKYGMRSGRRATRADLTRSLATLEAMLKPAPTVPTQPVQAPVQTAQPNAPTASGGGGPDQFVQCESHGNPNAVNPSSGARGAYQILPSTHDSLCPGMGYGRDCAQRVYDAQGPGAWSQCGG